MKKSTGQKIFKRCIVWLLIVLLVIGTIPITFAAEKEIIRLEIDDVTISQYSHGYIQSEEIGGKTVRYYYYSPQDWNLNCKLYYSDGSVEDCDSDFRYMLSYNTDQSGTAPWGAGDHTVKASYYDSDSSQYFAAEFTATISDDSVIESMEIPEIQIYENSNGYFTTDNEDNEYFYYNRIDTSSWIVHMKDGEDYELDSYGDIYYDGEYHYPQFDYDIQYNEHWGIGTHTIKGYLLGYEMEVQVTILENPIERIEAKDVTVIENVDGYESYDWVYNPESDSEEEVEYFRYQDFYPALKVYLKNGEVAEYAPTRYDQSIEIDGIKAEIDIETDQSAKNPWTVGNTYQATVSVMNISVPFNVTVSKTPIKSMDLSFRGSRYAYEYGEWVYDDDSGQKWFRYKTRYSSISGTVTMLDGTVIEVYGDNGISYNGNYYSFEFSDDQSYDNQWGVGTHEMEVEVLNFKTTVPFVIKPSPVKSADLTVSNLYEGIDSSKRWNEDYESYHSYSDYVSGTITFEDGTVIKLNNEAGFSYKKTYFEFEAADDQSDENLWGVGTHRGNLIFFGYMVPVEVNILPNPVKSIRADDLKLYEEIDMVSAYDWNSGDERSYDHYPIVPDLHVMLNDGTEETAYYSSSSYLFDFNGRTFRGSTVEDDQSRTNVWGIGDHQATISFLGKSCTVNIELLENPIKNISVEKVQPIESKQGYSSSDLRFTLNIEYKDGTSEQKAFFNPGSWGQNTFINEGKVDIILSDSQSWHVGKGNAFTVSYAGLETTAYVEILPSKEWDYTETDDGIIITRCYTDSTSVPYSVDGKSVVGVSANAFPKSIRSLRLGDNVRYITGTLDYPQLISISIGSSLEQLDTETVRYLPSLEEIYISSDNEYLTASSGVVYDKDRTKILAAAPAYPRLIEIPETVKDIEELKDEVYSDLKYYVADKSAYFTTVDGVTYSKDMKEVIACDQSKEGDFIMPDSVETIRDYAFFGCSNLTSVKVSDKVTDISYRAFSNCESLTSITLPKNLKSISHHAFAYDGNLSEAKLPATLEEIGECAFSQDALTSVAFGNSLKRIGYAAFNGNPLESVAIPDSVESVGSSAFSGTDITQATVGNSLIQLSDSTFHACKNLTSVTLGAKVRSIGSNCFESCSSLTDLTINSPSVEVGSRAFAGCSLKNFTDWDKLGGEAAYSAFRGTGIEQVSLPPTVTSLAYCSFAGSKDLASISLPDTLLKVDSKSFDGTKWFDEQENGVVYLDRVLYDCKGTLAKDTSLKVKDGTLSLAEHALLGQSGLTSITLPAGLKRIGNSEFYRTNISEITIPASVQEIGDRAFAGCKTLTSVKVDKDSPYFTDVDGVLYSKDMTELIYCPKRDGDSFKVPVSVTKIDSFAFADADISELTLLRDDVDIAPFAFGFDVAYDRNYGGIYGETYRVTYQAMKVICHEGSPAGAYAQNMMLDIEDTDERAFELGDADGDGDTNLMDVSRIQMSFANPNAVNVADRVAVDIDRNKQVEIIDATYLQRWLNRIEIPYEIIIKG